MPRPRFEKLPAEKRDRILTAAARTFAELGYERATVAQILGRAGISTGAAYYYFDDKADLFAAALTAVIDRLVASYPARLEAEDTETFWAEFGSLVRASMGRASDVHRTAAALRATWKSTPSIAGRPEIAAQFARNDALLAGIFRRGRELGAIRTDLPDTLLLRCGLALDAAFDEWLETEVRTRGRRLRAADLLELMQLLVGMLRAMFSPLEARTRRPHRR